ncbi:MAG: hypothetical protein U5L96_09025 [Owenweeksia sp.]|nr:hypothetical protein [Owenweeksia sp.]
MKKLTSLLLILSCGMALGQNLVENPSFENTGPCPVTGTVFSDFAEPWTNYFGTPDYYLPECAAPGNPQLNFNEQAFDGNAYAGIAVYGDSGTAFIREYLHGQLKRPLEKGEKYRVTFYVKPVNDDPVSYAIDNIGMALTAKPMDSVPALNIYPFTPQVETSSIVSNEGYWTAICGVYEAKGGEEFITSWQLQ